MKKARDTPTSAPAARRTPLWLGRGWVGRRRSLLATSWCIAEHAPGRFRASVFEFRSYQGTPDWHRLTGTDRHTAEQLLDYQHVDLTQAGNDIAVRDLDAFNFSSNVQFREATLSEVRKALSDLSAEQNARKITGPAGSR